jgi:hypothetical protein
MMFIALNYFPQIVLTSGYSWQGIATSHYQSTTPKCSLFTHKILSQTFQVAKKPHFLYEYLHSFSNVYCAQAMTQITSPYLVVLHTCT